MTRWPGEREIVGPRSAASPRRTSAHEWPATRLRDRSWPHNTLKDLVAGSERRFAEQGMHTLEGIPGEWRLFAAAPD